MFLKKLTTGMFASNCYILSENKYGVIIDPGADSEEILEIIQKYDINVKYIILTHAHIDHIVSMDELRDVLDAKVLVHEADADSLLDPVKNVSMLFGSGKVFNPADILLKDGDVIDADGLKIEVIHTPGHTAGSICLKTEDRIFTGDTLFRMSIGRTDLGNSDYNMLINSLKKIMMLDDSTIVYPGHGATTTIGYERKNNPFVY